MTQKEMGLEIATSFAVSGVFDVLEKAFESSLHRSRAERRSNAGTPSQLA